MEENCFCKTDKYAYPSICNRIFCCVCTGSKEELIKLQCCNNYVHRSCFINSSIIRRNNIINSKDTLETTKFSEIDICHYCKKPYNTTQFPNMLSRGNKDLLFISKNKVLELILIILWTILVLLSIGNALSDNILLLSGKNKGIELYKNKFIDNCKNYTQEDCSESYEEDSVRVGMFIGCIITIVLGGPLTLIYLQCSYSESKSKWDKYIFPQSINLDDVYKHMRNHYNNLIINCRISDYKKSINKHNQIYKSNFNRLIIPSIILIWQLIYLFIILGYNLWYIPSHTSSDTTVEDARKLVVNYIPILCFFNVLWLAVIGPIIFIIILPVYICFEWCIKNCIKCFNSCAETRKKIKNDILIGETNIKSFSIDIDNSLKKSSIV